jgi:tetratricopeptide (TPR) repeat protein
MTTPLRDALPDFEIAPSDLVVTAGLLLSRKPQLEKLVERKNYAVPELRALGFSTYDDAERALARINAIAGALLRQSVAANPDDPVALGLLAELYRERGDFEAALACDEAAASPGGLDAGTGVVKSLLALGRYEEALDAYSAARVIARDQLECIRLLPFGEWGERIGGEVRAHLPAAPFSQRLTCALDGTVVPVDRIVTQTSLRVVGVRDLTVIDGFIPVKGPFGHVFEHGRDILRPRSEIVWKDAFIRKRNSETDVIDEPCLYLCGVEWHYQNYYHALAQNFPRIATFLDKPEYAGLKIAVPQCIREWGVDFLNEIGIPPQRILRLANGRNALLKDAAVVEMRRVAAREEIRELRRRLGVDSRRRGTRRFFVGRGTLPSHPRLLVNEREIASIAAEHGFEVVEPGGMSIRQQIELFGDAAAICGPNGAAFGNLLYAPDDTAVICMSPRETVGTWYPDLAALCGQPFYWCFGQFLEEGRTSRQVPKVPYSINSDDFRLLLETAVGKPGR